MTPSPYELGVCAGERVRVKQNLLPEGSNPREVFTVIEAPAPPKLGHLILKGNLSGREIKTFSRADSLTEKLK